MTSMHSIYQTTHEDGLHACIADNHCNECRSKQSLSLLLRLSHAIELTLTVKLRKQLYSTVLQPDIYSTYRTYTKLTCCLLSFKSYAWN